jgi:acyl dehydratase
MPTLTPGDRTSRTKTISDNVIRAFAELTGDTNPVHLDDTYAAGTRFGRRIAHGGAASGRIFKRYYLSKFHLDWRSAPWVDQYAGIIHSQ